MDIQRQRLSLEETIMLFASTGSVLTPDEIEALYLAYGTRITPAVPSGDAASASVVQALEYAIRSLPHLPGPVNNAVFYINGHAPAFVKMLLASGEVIDIQFSKTNAPPTEGWLAIKEDRQ